MTLRPLFHGPDGPLHDLWRAVAFGAAAWAANGLASTLRLALPWPVLPAAGFTFLAVLAVTWMALELERLPMASVGLALDRRWARQFLAGLLAGSAIILAAAAAARLAGGFHWAPAPGASPGRLAAGAWLYLAVAASEELLFRGYLFQRLVRGFGQGPALAATAVLFTWVHRANPGMAGATRVWAGLNIALASVLLGLCYLRSRSLALPIGLHLGWNWTQGSLLGFGVSGLPVAGWWTPVGHGAAAWLTGGAFGLEASLPCTVVTVAACVILARARDEWLTL